MFVHAVTLCKVVFFVVANGFRRTKRKTKNENTLNALRQAALYISRCVTTIHCTYAYIYKIIQIDGYCSWCYQNHLLQPSCLSLPRRKNTHARRSKTGLIPIDGIIIILHTTFSNNVFHLVVNRATVDRARSTRPNNNIERCSSGGIGSRDVEVVY